MACVSCGRKAKNIRYWREIKREPCTRNREYALGEVNGHVFRETGDAGTGVACQRCGRCAKHIKYWKEIVKTPCRGPAGKRPRAEGEINGHLFRENEGRMECTRCGKNAAGKKYWQQISRIACTGGIDHRIDPGGNEEQGPTQDPGKRARTGPVLEGVQGAGGRPGDAAGIRRRITGKRPPTGLWSRDVNHEGNARGRPRRAGPGPLGAGSSGSWETTGNSGTRENGVPLRDPRALPRPLPVLPALTPA